MVWQALADGFCPPTLGLDQTRLEVFNKYKSSSHEFPS